MSSPRTGLCSCEAKDFSAPAENVISAAEYRIVTDNCSRILLLSLLATSNNCWSKTSDCDQRNEELPSNFQVEHSDRDTGRKISSRYFKVKKSADLFCRQFPSCNAFKHRINLPRFLQARDSEAVAGMPLPASDGRSRALIEMTSRRIISTTKLLVA